MTFDEIRSFAVGELGWSLEKYRSGTIAEFNLASTGYWRDWERTTAWLMREIVFTMICGNPYIKKEDKPQRRSEIMNLSMDDIASKVEKEKENEKKFTAEQIEKIRIELVEKLSK